MNPSPAPPVIRRPARHLWLWGLLAALAFAFLLLFVAVAVGVTSCFRLSPNTRALRNGLIKSSGVEWRQQIALNIGNLTLSAVRAGLSGVKLDAEARAILQAVRGAEVGLYRLQGGTKAPDRAAMLAAADTAMTARGWDRVAGVMEGKHLVAVYVTSENASPQRMKCCVMVFDGRQMVVASARANLEPLVQCVLDQPAVRAKARLLAKR